MYWSARFVLLQSYTMNLSRLTLLFAALAGGQILFCVVIYYLLQSGSFSMQEADLENLGAVPPIALAGSVLAAFGLSRALSRQGRSADGIPAKMQVYSRAVIVRLALVEGGNLLILVVTLLTGDLSNLYYFVAGMAAFAWLRPGKDNFVQTFTLDNKEQRGLDNL